MNQQRILADYFILNGLDSIEFHRIAYECSEKLKIRYNFNKESTCAQRD